MIIDRENVVYQGEDDDSMVIISDDIEGRGFHRTVSVFNQKGDGGYLLFNHRKEITGIFSIEDSAILRVEKEDWMRDYFPSVQCIMTKEAMQKWLPSDFENLPVKIEARKRESFLG